MRRAFLYLAVFALLPSPSAAQETPLELTRLSGPITLDGRPDESSREQIPPLPLTMYTPIFRGQPTQRTEIRVAFDDEYFYAAGWFYDTNPHDIRINSLYRDRWNGDDAFAIYIDAFNDNQNAKWFGTTAAGMRFDQLVSDDGATLNPNWDGFWTAATTVTEEGWFAEVRIPFSSLGFQVGEDGRAVMGLTVTRLVSRLDERVTFPEIDPKFPFRRPSVARDVSIAGVRTRTPLYLTPYVLAGVENAPGAVNDRPRSTDTTKEAGADARYALSGGLTLDLTVNTDFAQVEADDQQVALDRFPLSYPERRRFFQEGSGVFDFITSGGARLFHSRRIGLTSDFQPVRILGGARIVGRAGPWDIGALDMQTASEGLLPGENFGVARFRRSVFNPNSTAGMMVTSYYSNGRSNVGVGGDTSLRVKGDDYVTLKWAGTWDDTANTSADIASRSLFDARWERRTGRGLAYTWQFSRAGAAYDPELGFLPRRDFTTANVVANWYRFTDDHPIFKRVWPGALAFSTFRNGDGALESGQYAVWIQWETKAGGGGWVEPKVFREDVLEPFTIGGTVHIPAGRYQFADLQIQYAMPSGDKLRTDVDFRAGTYFDGRRVQAILTPTWNVSRHLELGADYQLTMLRFDVRNESANIHLARVRVRTALNARAFGNAFVQYNSTTGRVDFNVRLRYAMSEGTDLWLVYNEGLDADREPDLRQGSGGQVDPRGRREGPLSLSRAVILKYTYTFSF
jgi:hypothetical protein